MTIGFLIITPDIFFFSIFAICLIISYFKKWPPDGKNFNFSLTDTYSLQFGSVCPPLTRETDKIFLIFQEEIFIFDSIRIA